VGTCTVEDMIITDIENIRELQDAAVHDDAPASRAAEEQSSRRHRTPSSEHDRDEGRAGARSTGSGVSSTWLGRRVSSSNHSTPARRPSHEVLRPTHTLRSNYTRARSTLSM